MAISRGAGKGKGGIWSGTVDRGIGAERGAEEAMVGRFRALVGEG